MLSFDDNRCATLAGGYRRSEDVRPLFQHLEPAGDAAAAWEALWSELHHQGDVGGPAHARPVQFDVAAYRQRHSIPQPQDSSGPVASTDSCWHVPVTPSDESVCEPSATGSRDEVTKAANAASVRRGSGVAHAKSMGARAQELGMRHLVRGIAGEVRPFVVAFMRPAAT